MLGGADLRFTRFDIVNFKGIQNARIDLPTTTKPIISLIGLNESGKTTLLEAISHFLAEDEDVSALYPSGNKIKDLHDLVPKGKKANFSDTIIIRAYLELTDGDVQELYSKMLQQHQVEIDKSSFPKLIPVARTHTFKNSKFVSTSNNWTLSYQSKSNVQKKYRNVSFKNNNAEWNELIKLVIPMFPKICYFPSFLFDFPDRIYLTPIPGEQKIQKVYRDTVADILRSADKTLNVAEHIVDRLKKVKTENVGKNWKQIYDDSDDREQVDAAIEKMENEISRSVFLTWNEIFSSKIKNKTVNIELRIDYEKEDAPFLVFSIKDGSRRYALSERSLGFRWFFSFLLFTRFRRARGGTPTLFLFDEPASNLHARAQMKLLESLPHIITGESAIIYSTHSQYMIEPLRLEHSYIVENTAINFDGENEFDTKDTDIKATKYRTFVGSNPDKSSYFQPVLDKISFAPSPLEMPNDVLIMEGKGDFFVMSAAFSRIGEKSLAVFPSAGATTMDVQISLCLGFGRRFVVLCDDDKEGRTARDRYRKSFFLKDANAITYEDLDAIYSKFEIENFLPADMRLCIEQHFGGAPFSKTAMIRYFQEAAINDQLPVTDAFLDGMRDLASKLRAHMGATI